MDHSGTGEWFMCTKQISSPIITFSETQSLPCCNDMEWCGRYMMMSLSGIIRYVRCTCKHKHNFFTKYINMFFSNTLKRIMVDFCLPSCSFYGTINLWTAILKPFLWQDCRLWVSALIKGRITVREQSSDRTFRDFRATTLHLETNSKVASVLLTKSSWVRFHVQTSELLKCCCYKVCVSKQPSSCLLRGADHAQCEDIKSLPKLRRRTWIKHGCLWSSERPSSICEWDSYHRPPVLWWDHKSYLLSAGREETQSH